MSKLKIGFIGLGTMGYRMAKNISKQFYLNVFNRTTEIAKKHSDECNTNYCSTVDELYDKSQIILTCLPTSNEVHQISKHFKYSNELKYLIDCSSGVPKQTIQIGKELQSKNIRMLDCPISGGPEKAEMGNLCSMVGGNENDFMHLRKIFQSFSYPIYIGGLGSAHAVKSINNLLNVTQLCMISESLSVLKEMDIDENRALMAINKSSGRSLMSIERMPLDVLTKKYNYGFKLGLMNKDVKIALDLMKDNTMFGSIGNVMDTAEQKYNKDSDYTEVTKIFLK